MIEEVDLGDRTVRIVGTNHVSSESVEEVREAVEDVDLVGVELDQNRLASLRGDSSWKSLELDQALKEGKGYYLAASLYLSMVQRGMGEEKPGTELLTAVELAEEKEIPVELLDRDINTTLKQAWKQLTLREKARFLMDDEEPGSVAEALEHLENNYPSLEKALLEERNAEMAENLLEQDFDEAVLVTGKAHVPGLKKCLKDRCQSPTPGSTFSLMKAVKWGVPAAVLGMFAYGYITGGLETLLSMGATWIALNSGLSGLGAVVARASPAATASAVVSAPFTSMFPLVGAGMVAGYVEAKRNPPTVEELEKASEAEELGDFRGNQVGKVLFTFLAVSFLGASATYIASGLLALSI